MLNHLIDEINKSLEHECYFAALSLALTLPDICGKAQYPNASNANRYIKWYNEHVGQYEESNLPDFDGLPLMPYLSGEVIYNLRNSFLHQGTPNIDSDKIKAEQNKMDEFTLVLEKKNELGIYCDHASILTTGSGKVTRSYSVNVQRLCLVLTKTASAFYVENKPLFNFFTYSVKHRPPRKAKT